MRHPKIYAFFTALLVSLTSFTCDDVIYEKVSVINKSNETIYCFDYTSSQTLIESPICTEDFVDLLSYLAIPSGMIQEKNMMFYEDHQNARTYVMVIGQSTLDSLSKEEIIEKNIYDTLFVFSYKELKEMNFTISYEGRKK